MVIKLDIHVGGLHFYHVYILLKLFFLDLLAFLYLYHITHGLSNEWMLDQKLSGFIIRRSSITVQWKYISSWSTKNCLNLPPFGTEEFIQITTTFVTAEFIQITRCVFNKRITYFLQIFILARVSAGGRQFLYFAKK